MEHNGVISYNRCWKDISSKGCRTMPGIISYIETKKDTPGFPYVILADHLPAVTECNQLLQEVSGDGRAVLLALHANQAGASKDCWDLLNLGISDIIEYDQEAELIDFIESVYQRRKSIHDVLDSGLVKDNLVGDSPCWQNFLYEIVEVALYSTASILLIGESGTGKELISRLVHTIDKRPDKKKLIIVDCTTIVPELSGSELFGHERGSYTSAIQSREGAVALANGGTLFLDEVGELPLTLQAELLRVLQEGTYKKVGSNTWQKTNFRLVCATNKNLRQAVEEGKFRQDLYFRISDCEYTVPSLQERKEDVPLLVNYFLTGLFAGKQCPQIDKLVMEYLVQRNYPGNIRELRQLTQRIALKHLHHKKITIGEIPLHDRVGLQPAENTPLSGNIKDIIKTALLTGKDWWNIKDHISETAIQVALDLEGNNKQKAAERLGVDVRTVQQYVKKKTS
jgi:transcriptional regulator with GAF, ATPase, and Fis domain